VEELQRKEKHRKSETIEPEERNHATALPHNSMRAEFPFTLWTGRGFYYRKIREEMRVEKSWSHRFGAATVSPPNKAREGGTMEKDGPTYFGTDLPFIINSGWATW
jgi:hypothetical protein